MSELSIICTTYGHTKAQIDLMINSLLCQHSPEWLLYMVHDGPNEQVRGWVESYNDPRVIYRESPQRNGFWGHPNRAWILDEITTEWVTWGNADNYYTPVYVGWLKDNADHMGLDIALTNIVHNYPNVNGRNDLPYSVLEAGLGINRVDFISYIIRTDIAKAVGFNHTQYIAADGQLVEDFKQWCANNNRQPRWHHFTNVLAVHN